MSNLYSNHSVINWLTSNFIFHRRGGKKILSGGLWRESLNRQSNLEKVNVSSSCWAEIKFETDPLK